MPEFPINDQFGMIILSLELIIVSLSVQIAFFFFYKYRIRVKEQYPSLFELDWGILFLSFALTYSFFILGDFFPGNRNFVLALGYILLTMGGWAVSYHIERIKIINTKYLLTIFCTILLSLIIFSIFFDPSFNLTRNVANYSFIPIFGLLCVYFYKLYRRLKAAGYRFYVLGVIGVLITLIGHFGTTDIVIDFFSGFYIRVIADLLIIAGLIIIGYFLNSIPIITDMDWKKTIKYILIVHPSGVCLYHENFQERKEMYDQLLSGSLSVIEMLLQDTIEDQTRLEVISKGNDVFFIAHGEFINGIIVAEKEVEILKYLLKKLVKKFEDFHYDLLVENKWKGNFSLFKHTRHLVNQIFTVKTI